MNLTINHCIWSRIISQIDLKQPSWMVNCRLSMIFCLVFQRSVLGPLFFLIFINDLIYYLLYTDPDFSAYLFADDTTGNKAGDDLNILIESYKTIFSSLTEWCHFWNKQHWKKRHTTKLSILFLFFVKFSLTLSINFVIIMWILHIMLRTWFFEFKILLKKRFNRLLNNIFRIQCRIRIIIVIFIIINTFIGCFTYYIIWRCGQSICILQLDCVFVIRFHCFHLILFVFDRKIKVHAFFVYFDIDVQKQAEYDPIKLVSSHNSIHG